MVRTCNPNVSEYKFYVIGVTEAGMILQLFSQFFFSTENTLYIRKSIKEETLNGNFWCNTTSRKE